MPNERLTPKGYGEDQPNFLKNDKKKPVLDDKGERIYLTEKYINTFKSNEEKFEEYHQRNRRTSFKVVGEGFSLESL